MKKRLSAIILTATLLMPSVAFADASADGLGPATTVPGVSSSADSSALQSAGASTLQSNDGSATGLSSSGSDASTLQQPATSDNSQLQVILNGDVDGTSHGDDSSRSFWWYVLWIVIGLLVIGAGVWFWRRSTQGNQYPDAAEPLVEEIVIPAFSTEDGDVTAEVTVKHDAEPVDETSDDETVQNDEITPPIVGETTNETGDDSGKPAKRSQKKSRKRRSSRSRH